jgi:hypothetical protein
MGYTKPSLREQIVASVKAGTKGGRTGQWSARKAQIATQKYEAAGGGYSGPRTSRQQSLSKWTKEKWRTKSGKPSTQGNKATGERYLPSAAIRGLSAKEYAATSAAKRKGTRAGEQFVKQPKTIAKKTAKYR